MILEISIIEILASKRHDSIMRTRKVEEARLERLFSRGVVKDQIHLCYFEAIEQLASHE